MNIGFQTNFFKAGAHITRPEGKRLRENLQHFNAKCYTNWGFKFFWSALKHETKINFFDPKSAVQSHFTGKW